jgi:outer membrane protein TolC
MKNGRPAALRARAALTILAFTFSFAAGGRAAAQGQVVTLSQAVDQALAGGPDMRISRANLAIARAQYEDSASANGVGVTGSASYDRSPFTTGYSATGQAFQFTQNNFQGGLTLSAPLSTTVSLTGTHSLAEITPVQQSTNVGLTASASLWDGYPGGQALGAARVASYTLRGTESAESANQKAIVYAVKQAYYTLLGQQRQISILEQTLAQRDAELAKTRALFDAQSVSRIDLQQAQVNRLQADLDLKKARGVLEVDREQLSNLLGWPADREYEVAEVEDLPVPGLDVAAAVKTALASRGDLRQIELSLQSGEVSLELKKALAWPTLSVNTGVSWTENWTDAAARTTVHAGVSIKATVIDAGSLGAQIQEASLQKEKLRAQQEQLAATIASSVKSAVYSLQDLVARVELARQSLELAQDQYDLTELEFGTGVTSYLDVLAASVTLTTAKAGLAAARSAAQLGVLALQNAMGI